MEILKIVEYPSDMIFKCFRKENHYVLIYCL